MVLKLGLSVSLVDKSVFYYCLDGFCHGVIIIHVDDFLYGGDVMFHETIVQSIKARFIIGLHESKDMKYLGLDIKQSTSGIVLTMDDYIESIGLVKISLSEDKSRLLYGAEIQDFRHLIGQINWCATQVRVDVSFSNCQLSNSTSKPSVGDLLLANKTAKSLKSSDVSIVFTPLVGDEMKLLVFSDASFANLPSGGSQGAFVIFLADALGNANIVSWQSRKVRRVVKSTLCAECLAAVDAVNAAMFIKELVCTITCWKDVQIKLICDNKSLVQAVKSVTPVDDKRLRIDIAILQESLEKGELEDIHLVPSAQNLANVLTKQGASSKTLIETISGSKSFVYAENCFS